MVTTMATPEIVGLLNDLLAAPKTLGGAPAWRDMDHHGQWRLVMPVLMGGESTGLELEVCAYPNRTPLRFTIVLKQPKNIWRLEFDPTAQHTNSLNAPKETAGLIINGPHYHKWADNTRFVTTNALPKTMRNARVLPENINDFEAALDWFCRETNIEPPAPGAVKLPPRTELF